MLAPGGRLLIVDFAPHDLEFLREDFAHDRLGFAPEQVAQWMKDAGLDPIEQCDLAPEEEKRSGEAHRLVVAGRAARVAAHAKVRAARTLEEAP